MMLFVLVALLMPVVTSAAVMWRQTRCQRWSSFLIAKI